MKRKINTTQANNNIKTKKRPDSKNKTDLYQQKHLINNQHQV